MASSSGASGTPPRIAWHWGGVVASSMTIEANGTIAVRNNPGNAYEQFKASTITATSSMLSPIYYDSANGAYYGDFASTSVFNKLNTGIGNLGTSRSVSYSMTAGNWYRIASGAGRSCGDIYIQDGISGGPHGNITFYAGSSYSQYAGTMLKLKSSSFYSVIGFTEIRLLIGTTYQDQFVEIYCQRTGSYNITVQDTHYATNNWVLSTSATVGSVPTGYSDSTRLDINGMLIAEAGNGSNRFAVDRVGAIHLSGGTSGNSGQVLTSGGTGSPTWTTLQNQTGGPFLPLAGGTMSGNIQMLSNSLQFDQTGTRSWNISPASGNLNITSGDSVGSVSLNCGLIVADTLTANSRIIIQPRNDNTNVGCINSTNNQSDWQNLVASSGQFTVTQYNAIGSYTNSPTGVYTYGSVLSTRTANHSFQLYSAHTGDLAYKTQWNNDNYSGWLTPVVYGFNGGNASPNANVYGSNFIDKDNTAYYVDPASGSNLYTPITFQTNDSTLTFQDAGTNAFQMKMGAGDELYLGSNNNYQLQMTTSGNVNTQGQWRFGANFVKVGNSSTYNSDDGSWGSRFVVASTVHARIDCAQDANAVRASWWTHTGQLYSSFGTVTGHDMRLMAHNTTRQWLYSAYSEETASYRAPVFYDSNNTAYYGDFAGTSNLNGLTVANTITGTISQSNKLAITGYQTNGQSFYQTSGSFAGFSGWHNYYIGNHGNGSNYYNTTIAFPFWGPPRYSRLEGGTFRGPYNFLTNENDQTIGVYLQSTTSLRAPIFYDYNNTAFYLDPSTTGTSVNVAGDVVAYASSDIRFKNNITPITNALDKLSKIGGYTFEWNEISHKETGKKDIGVVAQEVEEILPEIVQTRSNGYKAVDYQKLTALLIESVKEQQVIINDLKTRIETLENN
jgi:hypothetical protein